MMLSSHLGCPLSLKSVNMGNPSAMVPPLSVRLGHSAKAGISQPRGRAQECPQETTHRYTPHMELFAPNETLPARIEYLKVQNFRALRSLELRDLTPLTVLLGPNGSGKSTVFDVFAFLSECFESSLRNAWDKRGRGRELMTRGASGPVVIEIKYRERPRTTPITYHLAVAEDPEGPVVQEEWLAWRRGRYGRPFRFLEYHRGQGQAISGELPDKDDTRVDTPLISPDTLAVNTLGQLADHPRVAALRRFITGWYVSYLSADSARGQPEAGPRERLSRTGDNLANVIQYLGERHGQRLDEIFKTLGKRVPHVERVLSDVMPDGRLLLQIKDAPFDHPILARYSSDGTLKMLAYLVLLHDPYPPPFIGIEEPENFLHPRLLYGLAEECRGTSEDTQLLVTTHSPYFLDALRSKEVRVLWRDEHGYTQAKRASDMLGVNHFMEEGAALGELWMEGHFEVGDPLTRFGSPREMGPAK